MAGEIQHYNDSSKLIAEKIVQPLDRLKTLDQKSEIFQKTAASVASTFNSIHWPTTITPRLDKVKLDVNVLRQNPKIGEATLRDNLKGNIQSIVKQFPELHRELTVFSGSTRQLAKKYPAAKKFIDTFDQNSTFLGKYRLMEQVKGKVRNILETARAHEKIFTELEGDLAKLEQAAILLNFPLDLGVDLITTMIPGMQVGKAASMVKWMSGLSNPQLNAKIVTMFSGRKELLEKMLHIYNKSDMALKIGQILG